MRVKNSDFTNLKMKTGTKGAIMQVKKLNYSVIRTARDGVDELDRVRREQGLSQMAISKLADMPDVGQQYYRMYRSGDVSISKYLRFLRAAGYELMMIKRE